MRQAVNSHLYAERSRVDDGASSTCDLDSDISVSWGALDASPFY